MPASAATAPRPLPSTAWREAIQPDEAERHASGAEQLAAMQREKSARYGTGRALHRKGLLALHATLRVHENLPAHAAHGLFALPGAHATWLRLSNGSQDKHGDRVADIRGFALRVQGCDGPAALGGATQLQDFVLINQPVFAFSDSRPFVPLVLAAARGPRHILGWAFKTYGPLGLVPAMLRLSRNLARPFSGFATEPFFSTVPIRCGPYAARVRLVPPTGQKPAATPPAHWADDVTRRLALGPLLYRLQLQFFVDEGRTPIEDAAVDWPEALAPFIDVADLLVEPQEVAGAAYEEFAAQVEHDVFDPWTALEAHRPLGEVMRSRKAAYFASQQNRLGG